MAQAQSDANAGTHADAAIHRLERWQNTQRITADVTRHDAIEFAQGFEYHPMRASFTELRRFGGGFSGLSGVVAGQDAAHPVHIQFSEPEVLVRALDFETLSPDGLDQVRVAL